MTGKGGRGVMAPGRVLAPWKRLPKGDRRANPIAAKGNLMTVERGRLLRRADEASA
jgi:hypothetical protein